MSKGDLVMLFTDGLFEGEPPRRTSAQEFFSRVLGDIREFARRETFDDVCVVGMQVQHLD